MFWVVDVVVKININNLMDMYVDCFAKPEKKCENYTINCVIAQALRKPVARSCYGYVSATKDVNDIVLHLQFLIEILFNKISVRMKQFIRQY